MIDRHRRTEVRPRPLVARRAVEPDLAARVPPLAAEPADFLGDLPPRAMKEKPPQLVLVVGDEISPRMSEQ